jgi:hypothetical protein
MKDLSVRETASHFGAINTVADGATVTFDCKLSDKHIVTLGGNRTLALSNDQVGQTFLVILKQDGTGSRLVTWFGGISWPGGTVPTLTTAAGKQDVFSFLKVGSGAYLGFASGLNL